MPGSKPRSQRNKSHTQAPTLSSAAGAPEGQISATQPSSILLLVFVLFLLQGMKLMLRSDLPKATQSTSQGTLVTNDRGSPKTQPLFILMKSSWCSSIHGSSPQVGMEEPRPPLSCSSASPGRGVGGEEDSLALATFAHEL